LALITGKNGVGKTSVLNYVQETLIQFYEFFNATIIKKKTSELILVNEEIETYKKYNSFIKIFETLDNQNIDKIRNSIRLYIPVLFKMHDNLQTKNDFNRLTDVLDQFFDNRSRFYRDNVQSQTIDKSIIDIFSVESIESLILHYRQKLDILNKHLDEKGFEYEIKIEKNNQLTFTRRKYKSYNNIEYKVILDHLSPGEKLKILFFIWEFTLTRFEIPHIPVLLLDEPDAHLHPKAVEEFVRILEKLSDAGAQIIMTSHNPTTVSFFKKENLFCMKRTEKDGKYTISIEKSESTVNAINELTSNCVMVNLPCRVVLVEGEVEKTNISDPDAPLKGKDALFYRIVKNLLGDLGYTYRWQFVFKSFNGCTNITGFIQSLSI